VPRVPASVCRLSLSDQIDYGATSLKDGVFSPDRQAPGSSLRPRAWIVHLSTLGAVGNVLTSVADCPFRA